MPELDVSLAVLVALAASSSLLGTLGGLGGAIFLVPLLILAGVEPVLAVPLGATSVVAGSLAAGPHQLGTGLVHHRIGISIEVVASVGAVAGAILSDLVSGSALSLILAVVALGAAAAAARPSPQRNLPEGLFGADDAGEWPGTLAGAYRLGDEVVPYQAKRVPAGLSLMSLAGMISGLAGVGGGFIKVPVMREVMHVPVKVAAATSTFTVGVTSAVSLVVFARQGRIDTTAAAAVIVGAVAGGLLGPRLAARIDPQRTRKVIAVLLALVAVVLLVRR
jgi:uncharacterized protein